MSTAAQRKERHHPREFLVTTFAKKPGGRDKPSADILWSEVWHAEGPLPLGYPFRWVLQKAGDSVRIRDLGDPSAREISEPVDDIPLAELAGRGFIEVGEGKRKCWVLIQPVQELKEMEASARTWTPNIVRPKAVSEAAAQRFLKRTSLGVTGAMLFAWLIILLLPKPQPTEELIPEEFAKVLLSPAVKQTGGQRRGGGGSGGGGTNVVAAFRSEAVQKTTKSLLNSKAAKRLLSGSTLLNTAASSAAARKVFDLKSALGSGPVATGKNLEVGSRQVGMLGGGKGTGSGTGTGYGTGGAAGVEGQGAGLVDVEGSGAGVSEGLTKSEVGKIIRDHMTEVRYCYDAALIRNPSFEGKVVVSFTVRPNGSVSGVRIKEASGDKALDTCISQRLSKWKFPKPRGGVNVDISYPFIFKVLGG